MNLKAIGKVKVLKINSSSDPEVEFHTENCFQANDNIQNVWEEKKDVWIVKKSSNIRADSRFMSALVSAYENKVKCELEVDKDVNNIISIKLT